MTDKQARRLLLLPLRSELTRHGTHHRPLQTPRQTHRQPPLGLDILTLLRKPSPRLASYGLLMRRMIWMPCRLHVLKMTGPRSPANLAVSKQPFQKPPAPHSLRLTPIRTTRPQKIQFMIGDSIIIALYALGVVATAHFAGIGAGGVLVLGALIGIALCFFLRRTSFASRSLILFLAIGIFTFLKIQMRI